MALMSWSDDMSVGVAAIDAQHQHLIALVNQLHEAMLARESRVVLGRVLRELVDYTTEHFLLEEGYFDEHGYPDADEHKKEHIAFAQRIDTFVRGFARGERMLTIEVMSFLGDWLREHILGTDKRYAAFFEGRGLR